MTDLELLELLEKAKEKQRGPQGPAGVGIDQIEQFEDDSFTIKLTTGESRKIQLPRGADGEVGAAGQSGAKGEQGAPGRAGRDGASGVDGQDGVRGPAGVSVTTGVVNPEGKLLIGLSDGTSINLGNVVGPAGAKGERGPAGLPGAAGKDGAAVLSGPRTPTQDDGKEGDFWIDISSAEFSFFKKSGTGWSRLASLRQPGKNPAVAVPVGSGGSGGGGKGEAQNTRTLPLFNPTSTRKSIPATLPDPGTLLTQEDANKYLLRAVQNAMVFVGEFPPNPAATTEGQLWWCTADDDLTLYIFTGTEWVAASPPVSLDGIESAVANIDEQLLKVNANVAMNKSELDEKALDIQLDQDRQDARLDALETQDQGRDFLPTAGGELKGTLEINGSRDKDGKINPLLCRADGYYMSFGVNKDGEVFAGSSEGQPFMAETDWHVVTKGYLNSQASRHFGSPYRFRSHGIPTNLTEGEFTYDKDWNWYAHRYDAAGSRIGVSTEDGFTHDGMFKVYRYNGSIDLICIMHRYNVCKTGQQNTNYFKWEKKESVYTHVEWLEESKTYYLSDGFLLPQ